MRQRKGDGVEGISHLPQRALRNRAGLLSCMAWSPGWQAPSVQLGLLQLRQWLSLFHPPISKNRLGKRCSGRSCACSAITNLIRFFSPLPSLHRASYQFPFPLHSSSLTPRLSGGGEVAGKSQCRWEARNIAVYSRSPDVSMEVRWSWGHHAVGTVMVILPWPDHELLRICFPSQ